MNSKRWRPSVVCGVGNAIILAIFAVYYFLLPGLILCRDLSDPHWRKPGGIPNAAWRVHRSLTPRYEHWARKRIASGIAAHLELHDVPSTEWPMFGSVFYLAATEALQDEWERDPSRSSRAPREYARGTIDACTDLLLDPAHHTWVRQHWGDNYLHTENVFFRAMLIQGLTSRERLLHDGKHLDLLRDQVETLAADLDKSKHGLLHDYPGECYPIDVFAAIICIRKANAVLGTDHSAFSRRAMRGFSPPYLDERGLIPFLVDLGSGQPSGSARGIGMSYVLIYAPELAPETTTRWYETYVRYFWQDNWLASGFREFPRDMPGENWLMDPDSGPVLFGFSPAGDAYGIAAARVNGRFDQGWTLAAEALTASWQLPDGELLGARLLSSASRGHAPYLGEANLLFLFTRPTMPNVPIVTGGHLTTLIWIGFALMFGGAALLLWQSYRLGKMWYREMHPVRGERLQAVLWALLLIAAAWFIFNANSMSALLSILLAQLLPRRPQVPTLPTWTNRLRAYLGRGPLKRDA